MRLRIATAMLLISLSLLFIAPPSIEARISVPTADSSDVAAIAAKTLADSGDKDAIPILRRMLNHPSIVVRYYAAYGLGKLGDKESIQALEDSLWLPENDTPDNLMNPPMFDDNAGYRMNYVYGGYRLMACWALRQLGDTSVDKRFIEILEDQNADVKTRQEAYRCLEQLGTEAAYDAMCKVAKNDKVDFKAGQDGRSITDSSWTLTQEQEKELFLLAAQNMNLPEDVHKWYQKCLSLEPLSARIETAKTAEDLKQILLEEQEKWPEYMWGVVHSFTKFDLESVEDWMLQYITDYYSKNKKHDGETVSDMMLDVLREKGTQKCLPVLGTLLEDKELPFDVRGRIAVTLHGIGHRCVPDGAYLVLGQDQYLAVASILKDWPEDATIILNTYKASRADAGKQLGTALREMIGSPPYHFDESAREIYIATLLAWNSPELIDFAVGVLKAAPSQESSFAELACMILRKVKAVDKLPDVQKFWETTHFDWWGVTTYTMYSLGDKGVPKKLLSEIKTSKAGAEQDYRWWYLRLLIYEDADCQKYFFDLLMKDTPYLEDNFLTALNGNNVEEQLRNYPINIKLAVPAIEKILMNGKKNYMRMEVLSGTAKYAAKEPEVVTVIQKFAEHAMDVCDQARKLIPQLADPNEDVRKKTREELEKLGLDATPAFEEGLNKYPDPEIQRVLKELLDSYKASNTGY